MGVTLIRHEPHYLIDFWGIKFGEYCHTDYFEIECDICGKKALAELPGGGYVPSLLPFGVETGMISIHYGIARKRLWFCKTHRDSEVEAVIEERR